MARQRRVNTPEEEAACRGALQVLRKAFPDVSDHDEVANSSRLAAERQVTAIYHHQRIHVPTLARVLTALVSNDVITHSVHKYPKTDARLWPIRNSRPDLVFATFSTDSVAKLWKRLAMYRSDHKVVLANVCEKPPWNPGVYCTNPGSVRPDADELVEVYDGDEDLAEDLPFSPGR
ncbi:hypothetical protein HPB52_004989 [Rhipicephalus sanguineus]|uniref:Uncharacterized protein n=1 Tax=Rhipicephalus sanguineus TaxID=34632 RepID=A0A9D4T3U9_RHISA|nr:hypothetical protein HPB52_004989 [Rhipicephalus sanguineus]